jgi:hypothetical protein
MTMKRILCPILCLTFTLLSCVKEPTTYPNTWRGNFEALWHIIDTRYCYLDYKHINWDSIYVVYSQRVDTVSNQYVLFDVLGDMLDELKDGHVNLSSSFNRSRYWNWFQDYPSNFDGLVVYNSNYLGKNYRIAGGMNYERIAQGKIGYIYYSSFSSSFSNANFLEILNYFSNCKGIIIDVRNNGGGTLVQAQRLSSYFFAEKTLTGYITHKNGEGHSDFSSAVPIYVDRNSSYYWEKPVIVLSNRMSYSATNCFISQMKYAPNATIMGDRSGGGGGLPMSNELPIGWAIRYSASPFYDADMQHIEWGIEPDVQVSLDDDEILRGYDTIIEAAVDRILNPI